MNADTINAIMNMGAVQSLSSQSLYDTSSSSGSGSDFSSMLSSMLGTQSGGADALANLTSGGTVDYNTLLSSINGGVRIQYAQYNAMADALKALMEAEKPMVTDPVLAQLLEAMKGLSSDTQEADIPALLQQMQQRLKQMLDEDGAAMASQEALALTSRLIPLLASLAPADAMTESLNEAGDAAALDLMLQKSPQELVTLMGGQPQTAQNAGQEALPQTPAGTQQTREFQVESAETSGAQGGPSQSFAQMLETGKAQGDFASAVRAVKEQMPESKSLGEDVDVDELQKQVDATDLSIKVRTSDVAEAAGEVRQSPQPVPAQLEQAVAKGIANGEEQILVKLNPEELGEVTIQMLKAQDGGFILNIIAKNPDTQRLLAAELAQLQQSMRPLNVEVESITTEQEYQMANAQQQFGGQHQRSWKEMHGAAYYGDEPLSPAAEQGPAKQVQTAPASALDAYI